MYLVFDWSDVSLCSPVDCIRKINLHIKREIGTAIPRSIMRTTTEAIHQFRILDRFLKTCHQHS